MLPSMTELVPPFSLYNLTLIDFVNGPELFVSLIVEYALEYVFVVEISEMSAFWSMRNWCW